MPEPLQKAQLRLKTCTNSRLPQVKLELSEIRKLKDKDQSERSSIAGDIELLCAQKQFDNDQNNYKYTNADPFHQINRPSSSNRFRRRSLGSKHNLSKNVDSIAQQEAAKIHHKLSQNKFRSKSRTINRQIAASKITQPQRPKLEIERSKPKLKKKPLKIQINELERQQEEELINLNLQKTTKTNFNDLLLKRPTEKNKYQSHQNPNAELNKNYLQQKTHEPEQLFSIASQKELHRNNIQKIGAQEQLHLIIIEAENGILERYLAKQKHLLNHQSNDQSESDDGIIEKINLQQRQLIMQEDESIHNNYDNLQDNCFEGYVLEKAIITRFGVVKKIYVKILFEGVPSLVKINEGLEDRVCLMIDLYVDQSKYRVKLIYDLNYIVNKSAANVIDKIISTKCADKQIFKLLGSFDLNQSIQHLILCSIDSQLGSTGHRFIQVSQPLDKTEIDYLKSLQRLQKYQIQKATHQQLQKYFNQPIKEEINTEVVSKISFSNNVIFSSDNIISTSRLSSESQNLTVIVKNKRISFQERKSICLKDHIIGRRSLPPYKNNEQGKASLKLSEFGSKNINGVQKYSIQSFKPLPGAAQLRLDEIVSKFFMVEDMSDADLKKFYCSMKLILMQNSDISHSSPLSLFFDICQVKYLSRLMNQRPILIKMSCYRVRKDYNRSIGYFYKFQLQQNSLRTKTMKFVATGNDVRKYFDQSESLFTKEKLLESLLVLAEDFVAKKSLIYHSVGLQLADQQFYLSNKFNQQIDDPQIDFKCFLNRQLKVLSILCQKSMKITVGNQKSHFSVITVLKVVGCELLQVKIYFPKFQRNFQFQILTSILSHLSIGQLDFVIGETDPQKQTKIVYQMFQTQNSTCQSCWSRLISLLRFEIHQTIEQRNLIAILGSYIAFVKDSSVLQYLDLNGTILCFQISMEHLSLPPPSRTTFRSRHRIPIVNAIPENNLTDIAIEQTLFHPVRKILEPQTSKYVLYVTINRMQKTQEGIIAFNRPKHKSSQINLSFYLSQLKYRLQQRVKQRQTSVQGNDFNETYFIHSDLLIELNGLKDLIINLIRQNSKLDDLFDSLKHQELLKSQIKLHLTSSQNIQRLSLNKTKYKLEGKSTILLDRRILSINNRKISCIFFNEQNHTLLFFVTANKNFTTLKKTVLTHGNPFPFIDCFQIENFIATNQRLFKYYANMLKLI